MFSFYLNTCIKIINIRGKYFLSVFKIMFFSNCDEKNKNSINIMLTHTFVDFCLFILYKSHDSAKSKTKLYF